MRPPSPKRSLGQNFLQDEGVVNAIIDALRLTTDDHVIEIGPGRGALTRKLVERQVRVTAIEIDRELAAMLRSEFGESERFRVIEGDYLQQPLGDVLRVDPQRKAKVVGNLPYYVSTAILQKLSAERSYFSRAVLMLQREVVDRIMADPGDSDRGFLTVLIGSSFAAERVLEVAPGSFYPRPKVSSSVIALTPKEESIADEPSFRQLLGVAFAHKRKTILNNLKGSVENAAEKLEATAIEPKRRAETLSLDEWQALFEVIEKRPKTP